MIQLCALCHEPLETGDIVTCAVESVYKRIPRVDQFALSEDDLVYLPETLTHKACKGTFNVF